MNLYMFIYLSNDTSQYILLRVMHRVETKFLPLALLTLLSKGHFRICIQFLPTTDTEILLISLSLRENELWSLKFYYVYGNESITFKFIHRESGWT